MMLRRSLGPLLAATLVAGCGPIRELELDELGEAPIPPFAGAAVVPERWLTARDEADNVDSLATWHGRDGQHWLLATAKEADRLLVYDAASGALLRTFGGSGTGPGQFDRPNGIFVLDDLVFVVERDNHRVQLLRLPGFEPLARFGEDALIKPYGLWVQPLDSGFRVYVTDNYEDPGEAIPPLERLDARVKLFSLQPPGERWQAELERSFGDTGASALLIVESIWGDPASGQLMIADEEQYRQRHIEVYQLDGTPAGRRMGAGVFRAQPEGIALYECRDGSGYWFAADQGKDANFFHVFERRSREYLGSFEGEITLNTDGVWLDRRAIPGFPHGAFYAVHDDGSIAAFDLRQVLAALKLPRC